MKLLQALLAVALVLSAAALPVASRSGDCRISLEEPTSPWVSQGCFEITLDGDDGALVRVAETISMRAPAELDPYCNRECYINVTAQALFDTHLDSMRPIEADLYAAVTHDLFKTPCEFSFDEGRFGIARYRCD